MTPPSRTIAASIIRYWSARQGSANLAFAQVIALEMATDFLEVIGQSITSPADLNGLLLQAKDKSVVHIDEAHELAKQMQTALYLALDKRKVFINGSRAVQSIPIADFTLLLSTTDEYNLLQPLRDRMRLVLRFEFYPDSDLTKLLAHRIKALGWDVHEELLPLIAQTQSWNATSCSASASIFSSCMPVSW